MWRSRDKNIIFLDHITFTLTKLVQIVALYLLSFVMLLDKVVKIKLPEKKTNNKEKRIPDMNNRSRT